MVAACRAVAKAWGGEHMDMGGEAHLQRRRDDIAHIRGKLGEHKGIDSDEALQAK